MFKRIFQLLFLASLLFFLAPKADAWGDNYCDLESDCCDYCDDCGPLRRCGWSVQIKGGVAPSHYTSRGPVWLTVPALTPAVFTVSDTAHFYNQFHTPWEVGGEIAWNPSENVQFFLEGLYQRGSGKTYDFTAGAFIVSEVTTPYETWGGYVGARYYFDRIFCRLSPFVGFKAGILHQSRVDYSLSLFGVFIQTSPYYKEQWVPSAGAQIGFDWLLTRCLSFVFTAEAVVTQGLKNNRNNVIEDPTLTGGLTNVNIGETGKIVSFPVTFGLRYNF